MSTKVTRVVEKQFDDGNWSYSFQTQQTGSEWLRGGKNRFKGIMEEGNTVEITTNETKNRQGKTTVYLEAATLVVGPAAAKTSASVPSSAHEAGTLTTQSKIEYQAARNSAIEYLKLVVGSSAAKIPEAQAAKLKALDAYLDHYTAQFFADTQTAAAAGRAVAKVEAKIAGAVKSVKAPETVEEEEDLDE
jgi:hypothetical protein